MQQKIQFLTKSRKLSENVKKTQKTYEIIMFSLFVHRLTFEEPSGNIRGTFGNLRGEHCGDLLASEAHNLPFSDVYKNEYLTVVSCSVMFSLQFACFHYKTCYTAFLHYIRKFLYVLYILHNYICLLHLL